MEDRTRMGVGSEERSQRSAREASQQGFSCVRYPLLRCSATLLEEEDTREDIPQPTPTAPAISIPDYLNLTPSTTRFPLPASHFPLHTPRPWVSFVTCCPPYSTSPSSFLLSRLLVSLRGDRHLTDKKEKKVGYWLAPSQRVQRPPLDVRRSTTK